MVETKPETIRQIISSDTSKKVGGYLETVVSDQQIGSGKNAYIPGYRVAGKTGTAQKVVGKGYSSEQYVVSFIGYAPVDHPRIVVYVIVDSPNSSTAGGGAVAAPVFKKIVSQSLRHMGIKPDADASLAQDRKNPMTVPDLTGLTVKQAQGELKSRDIPSKPVGKGDKVLQQIPPPGTVLSGVQSIYLITEEQSKLTLPSLQGLSLRDALQLCSSVGRRCVTEGEGYVVSQMEAKLNGEPVVKLVLKPPAGAADASATTEGTSGGATDSSLAGLQANGCLQRNIRTRRLMVNKACSISVSPRIN